MKTIKRYIAVAALTLAVAANVNAQEVWKNSSPVGISYSTQTLKEDATGLEYKSDFAFGIFKRKTFNLHKYPIADVLMFGLDVNFLEVSVARYAKGKGLSLGNLAGNLTGTITSGNYASFDDYFNDAYNQAPDEGLDDIDVGGMLNRLNVGKFQITAHVVGIGPSVKVAPFGAGLNSTLSKIKLTGYFHYLPTYSALVFTGDGDDEDPTVCGGYMSCWRGGASLQYGRIGIGVERFWGSGNLKKLKIGDGDNENEGLNITKGEKSKYLLSGLRFYVGLKF